MGSTQPLSACALSPRSPCLCEKKSKRTWNARIISTTLVDASGVGERLIEGCEFCGLQYRFDAVDVGELFTPPADQPPGSSVVN